MKRQFETIVVAGVLGLAAMTFALPAGAQSLGTNIGGNSIGIGGSNGGDQNSVSGNAGTGGGSTGNFNISRSGNRSTGTINLGSFGGSTGTGTLSLGGGQGALGNMTVGSLGQTGGTSIGTGGLLGGGHWHTPGGVASAFGELSPAEQKLLQKKCTTVMSSPGKFGSDIVALCSALASL